MLLVTLPLKTLLSISQNGINQITLNKQSGNYLNRDIIIASSYLQLQKGFIVKAPGGELVVLLAKKN
jgi:hypothetical protein